MASVVYRRGRNNNPFECCMDCPNRKVGCHSRCEVYKNAKAIDEGNKARFYKERLYVTAHIIDKVDAAYGVKR